jgi:hypothetical protein
VPEPSSFCAYILRYRLIASRWAANEMTLEYISVMVLELLNNSDNVTNVKTDFREYRRLQKMHVRRASDLPLILDKLRY